MSEARSVSGDRLLVLLDDLSDRSQYSLYFDGFESIPCFAGDAS